jgi:dipeptidyl-peptidase-4
VQVGFTGAASGDDPKFSPNGEMVSFVRDHGLSVLRLKDAGMPAVAQWPSAQPDHAERRGGLGLRRRAGRAQQLLLVAGFEELAYLQMNETEVPEYPITDWIPTHAKVDLQRFPQPGDPNPDVRVGVVGAAGARRCGSSCPFIPARITFRALAGSIARRCGWRRSPAITSIAISTLPTRPPGSRIVVLQLSDDKFIDDNYDVSVGYGTIVLTNWTDGHNHLYLYSYDQANPDAGMAKLERQLTKGDFEVATCSASITRAS